MQKTAKTADISRKIYPNDFKNFSNSFPSRHIGPSADEQKEMLNSLALNSLDELISKTVPASIRVQNEIQIPAYQSEAEILVELKKMAQKNKVNRTLIGMGFHDTIVPGVIQRNILENPGWYTQYTPYQAEIAQGRLEALLNFQTLTLDLTGLSISNASLLDEATACAEAMHMAYALKGVAGTKNVFYISEKLHPQNIEVIRTRARPLGIEVKTFSYENFKPDASVFGVVFQYPDTEGQVCAEIKSWIEQAHAQDAIVTLSADPLSLLLLKSPGSLGADIAVGSFQRFGVPLGFGGPSAAYMACKDEFKRMIPGRLVGVSKDSRGKPAIRLALQTREQHIRREKATSNICTSQVLLAIMSSMYAVYHGPEGLREIAKRVHGFTLLLARAITQSGFKLLHSNFFDTVTFECASSDQAEKVYGQFLAQHMNLRKISAQKLSINLDEVTTVAELNLICAILSGGKIQDLSSELEREQDFHIPEALTRTDDLLAYPVFRQYHSEHEMLRYIASLERKDLSLNFSMIPLGSCTMKLNATVEMTPVSWPEFARMHPVSPANQTLGYKELFKELESMLGEVTGFDGISLQPNAGSQGEYAGLLTIRAYHESRGESHRDICLIPKSAHGTNPASAAMAGMKVVVVDCDSQGNVDLGDLERLSQEHSKNLAALMVTYPSTHGVFETKIKNICEVVHANGGQVYMDGANMNAQIGLCKPGEFGPDVCHLNLHKTFCIPHGGGGPGMGPIGVKKHLVPFLPGHPFSEITGAKVGGSQGIGAIAAAPWGSASILTISWVYMKLMGSKGLKRATEVAILNANYIAKELSVAYPVLYRGENGLVAHECILDLRPLKNETGVEVEDIAKRLMDYGFHAPTISFPVPGTLMIEPTESEGKAELDRFIDAMLSIRQEIEAIKVGKADRKNNLLKNSPHTAEIVTSTEWMFPYSREEAAFPKAWVREKKFWPSVARIDNAYGDRNLVCSCPPLEAYQD